MDAKTILHEAINVIEKFAPNIASFVLGAPEGIATDIIVRLLKRAFDVNSTDVPSISSSIINHPECDVRLCLLEHNYGELFKDWFDKAI